jgi:hypothetical protein
MIYSNYQTVCSPKCSNCSVQSSTAILYCTCHSTLAMDWTTRHLWFNPWQGQRIFPVASVAHPASCPWVPVVFSLGIKRGRGMTLTTHPELEPRWMSRSYTSSPPQAAPWRAMGLLCLVFFYMSNKEFSMFWITNSLNNVFGGESTTPPPPTCYWYLLTNHRIVQHMVVGMGLTLF